MPCRSLLSEIQHSTADPEIEEKQGKLEQLKSVLEMYGHFSGINRKVQMKYQPKGRPRGSSSDDGTELCPLLLILAREILLTVALIFRRAERAVSRFNIEVGRRTDTRGENSGRRTWPYLPLYVPWGTR